MRLSAYHPVKILGMRSFAGWIGVSCRPDTMFGKLVYIMILMVAGFTGRAQSVAGSTRFYSFDKADLTHLKELYLSGDANTVKQVDALLKQADSLLSKGPWSVTYHKTRIAPGGSKNDYLSQAPYWWPDSSKADGKPYIRKDGQRNPEIYQLHDAAQMDSMVSAVKKLAVANYLKPDQRYVKKVEHILMVWFLARNTAMNPSLTYAQYIPGVNNGRGIGIIETNRLLPIPDAITLLQDKLNPLIIESLRLWFKAYNDWLLNSANGKDEQDELNNHGTWYDVQTCTYALFYGDEALAKNIITKSSMPRIAVQFTADGKQPRELARTRSWDYSNMNLMAWARLAFMAQQLHIDLWHYQTDGGKGIENAIRFLLPYAAAEKPWPYQEIGSYEYGNIKRVVQLAKKQYPALPANPFYQKFPANDLLTYIF